MNPQNDTSFEEADFANLPTPPSEIKLLVGETGVQPVNPANFKSACSGNWHTLPFKIEPRYSTDTHRGNRTRCCLSSYFSPE